MPTSARTMSTRERLLQAAVAAIDAEGVDGLRIREIAAAAGVREPSVYHFFGSREGLVEAALVERFGVEQSVMFRSFGEGMLECRTQEDFVNMVIHVVGLTASTARAQVRRTRADVVGSAQSRPSLMQAVNEALVEANTLLAGYLESAQIRGWVQPSLKPMTFAIWLAGLFNGLLYLEMNEDAYSRENWVEMATSSILLQMGYVDGKPIWS